MNPDKRIRVLIVDDHTVVRDGLRFILKTTPDIHVVGTASDGARALRLCMQFRPDVVLMDLVMPEMDGIMATHTIRTRYPETQVIALTSFHEEDLVHRALQAGAISYLLKNAQAHELIQAIRAAQVGQSILAPEATQALVRTVAHPVQVDELTAREQEVLAYLTEGLTNAQIAVHMHVTRNTVRHHVRNVLAKLGATNRTEAASIAIQRNLVIKGKREQAIYLDRAASILLS